MFYERDFVTLEGRESVDLDTQQAADLLTLLRERGYTLSAAEGSTGGALSALLTAPPGASAVFTAGAAVYADRAKEQDLGLPIRVLRRYGAVSAQAAAAMAHLVRRRNRTDLGIAVTGIEGPGGGSREKPVGTTYLAVTDGQRTAVQKLLIAPEGEDSRAFIRRQAVLAAVELCAAFVQEKEWVLSLLLPARQIRTWLRGNPVAAFFKVLLPWRGDRPADVFFKLLFIAAIAACAVAAAQLTDIAVTNHHTAQVLEQAVQAREAEPTSEVHMDLPEGYLSQFAALYQLNPDIAGWITIPDTNINLPVVQGEDNSFYLRHDLYGEEDFNGLPFLDCRIQLEPQLFPTNLLIYSHNMESGMMFRDLVYYKDPSYYQEHPIITFDTVYDQGQWVIISCFEANTVEAYGPVFSYFNFLDSQDPDEIQWYIDEITSRSYFQVDIDVGTADKFLTLQTCANDAYETKICVVARRLREGESPQDFDFQSAVENPDRKKPVRN